MASGDTINGQIRIVREDTEGNIVRVFGPIDQSRVDAVNSNTTAEEKLYLNTVRSDRKGKPAGAENQEVPDAIWESGEKLFIQHQADATVSNDIDPEASGAFELGSVSLDLNRNNFFPEVLRATNNEISGTVSESTSEWVSFFEFTVPDRTRLYLAGRLMAAAIEA